MSNSSSQPEALTRRIPRLLTVLGLTLLMFMLISVTLMGLPAFIARANPGPALSVQIIAAYNLVVDSNVLATSTYAPSVATVGGKICNTGDATATGVQAFIGNYKGGVGSTPGAYPTRDSNSTDAAFDPAFNDPNRYLYLKDTGLYSFSHVGGRLGTADASRYVGSLAPGQCQVQYWHFTYPRRSNGPAPSYTPNAGNQPTWGQTRLTTDDLALGFDVWATGQSGLSATKHQTMTVRNEISAMANKIQPNPDGEWFNTNSSFVQPGDVITSNGILYELGVINQGFDNDGNFTPDYNAWVQPIGDPNFDPSCFRLIRVSGVLTVSRSAGNPDLIIPFTDQMYFTYLPPDNNGVRGLVFYTFLALNGPCSTAMSPYQEVASGSNNEKFNGDFGVGIPPISSSAPQVGVSKSGPTTATSPGRITYTIGFNNFGTINAGLPAYNGALTFSDTIPVSGTLVPGSLSASLSSGGSVSFTYSTDNGATWSPVEPTPISSVTTVRIALNDTLPPGATGIITYSMNLASGFPPPGSSVPPIITNCVGASYGQAVPFASACATTLVQGTNTIGDWVWRDENGNGVQDDGATGIPNVTVSLYYDLNGNGVIDASDLFVVTSTTSITGWYSFNQLPNGNFLVQVDKFDPDLPFGYAPTTAAYYSVPGLGTTTPSPYLNADFGFGPVLRMSKDLVSSSPAFEGDSITFTIRLTNTLPGNGTGLASTCAYTTWATAVDTINSGTGNRAWTNPGNAINPPDGLVAIGPYANVGEFLSINNFKLGAQAGNITSVTVVLPITVSGAFGANDTLTFDLLDNGTPIAPTPFRTYNANTLATGVLEIDMTTARAWTWADFNSTRFSLRLTTAKQGNPTGKVGWDAGGFRINTNQLCGGSDGTIATLPLTDTYNALQLQFQSARPPQSTLYTTNTPYTTTGVISWTNLGPLYAGQSKVVTVSFKALEPGALSATTINTATVNNAAFGDGRRVNNGIDDASVPVSRTTSIGDFVWRDLNANGLQDDGPTSGIPGVVISLTASAVFSYNGVNIPVGTAVTTTTDANGYYLFDGIRNVATFTTTVNVATLPTAGLAFVQTGDPNFPNGPCVGAQCDNRYGVGITNVFTDVTWADFGYQLPSLIDGNIWSDLNRSGTSTRDTGEPLLPGVQVTLRVNGVVVATTTTDANGYYRFVGNYTGPFSVTVNTGTLPPTGTWTETFDKDGIGTPNQVSGTITAGGSSTQNDFSYYQSGTLSIGDTVYTDWNGNAVQDAGEGGIANVVVSLYRDNNGNGVYDAGIDGLITSTTTSNTGFYQFTQLPGGGTNYVVVVNRDGTNLPNSYTQTYDPSYPVGTVCTVCNDQGSATLLATNVFTVDFGYKPFGYGAIGDTVWKDQNGNGLQDAGEVGIPNITVTLYADTNGNGVFDAGVDTFISATNTITAGYYLFPNLPAGNYLVAVNTADADLPKDSATNYTYSPSTSPVVAVALTATQVYLDADFGFSPPARIGDTVYWDANGNGQQDWNEGGIGGVSVTLSNNTTVTVGSVTYPPGAYILTTTTTITGFYQFVGLVPATYTVKVLTGTLPYPATLTGDPDTTVPCPATAYPAQAPFCDSQTTQHLAGGQVFLNADFGYQPAGVIGDFVFQDLNSDGIQNPGEPGIPGVVVTVTNGVTTFTTTTDIDGRYSFTNVPDGTWSVLFQTPANMISVPSSSGTPIVNGVGSVGTSTSVVISGGTVTSIGGNSCTNCSLNVDSGFNLNGLLKVSGHIFFDARNDGGLFNPTDPITPDRPYAGIAVYLYDTNNQLIGTTTTDASGTYTFTNLPGNTNYTVAYDPSEPNLVYMTQTSSPASPTGKCSPCLNYYLPHFPVTTTDVINLDFGLYSQIDFGDLPDSYRTSLAENGPRHVITDANVLYLGTAPSDQPDIDGDAYPSANATGDNLHGSNDENGVQRQAGVLWVPGNVVTLNVTVSGNNGYLVGWFDWNQDGTFTPNEQVTFGSLTAGVHQLTMTVPNNYTTGSTLAARFRLYDGVQSSPSYFGLAVGGEVEDYMWPFTPTAIRLSNLTARATAADLTLPLALLALALGVIVVLFWRRRRRV